MRAMRRRNWYLGQLVTEGHMDTAFADVETSVWRANGDLRMRGVLSGHVVGADSPASMDVVISGGLSYTPDGKRCFNVGDTTLDCSVDRDSISTAVVATGKTKIVSVFVTFDRTVNTPEYDTNGQLIFTIEDETLMFEVMQGSEVSSPTVPTPPALRSDAVLLADITLIYGQTTITSGDISTARRQSLVVLTRANASKLHHSTIESGVQNVLDILENHIGGSAENHNAHDVTLTVDTAVNWADGNDWCTTSTVAVDDAIETHVVAKLASIGATSGAHRLGVFTSTYQSPTIPTLAAGPLFTRLESMRDASNIYIGGLPSWPSGDNSTNPAAALYTSVNKLVSNLVSRASDTDQGVRRIGLYGTGFALASWQALGAASLHALCAGLNSATGTDGASYVAAKAVGALTAGTVRSQVDELDTRVTSNTSALAGKANLSGATFSGAVIHNGTLEANSTAQFDGAVTANAGITVASGQDLTLNGASVQGVVGFSSLGRVWLLGRKQLWRARQTLADSNHTVNVTQGDRFTLPTSPAAPRVITLQSTVNVPEVGETLTFFWQPGTTAIGAGTQYTFRNEAATTLLTFDGSAVIDTGLVWAEFEFVAGAWVLGLSSSTLHDGSDYYGAIKPKP
jgi:hypothetical protein